MNMKRISTSFMILAIAVMFSGLTACAGMSNKEKGAVIGAGTGAAVGGAIGSQTGSTARGAIIGATVAGAAGAIIGHQMDQQAKSLEGELEGATVERVGQGIQVTFEDGILFPFDSDRLQYPGQQNLGELSESLRNYPNTEILIVGHTDATGDADYNMDLSMRRSQSAAQYLMAQGVNRDRIRITGRGELEPVATNSTEAGRQLNRRVEIAIFAEEEYREALEERHSHH